MNKGKLLAVCIIWLVIFGIGTVAWKLIVSPMRQAAVDDANEQAEKEIIDRTSADEVYDATVSIALDSFSGYAVLRSDTFRRFLGRQKIRLELSDDQADYEQRLANLDTGKVEMAAFTVDALIKESARSGGLPATIVALIDESHGADAMVAYRSFAETVADLNRPDIEMVLMLDTPSETLARVVMSTFELDQLPANPFKQASSAEDVYTKWKQSSKNARQVYVLWEPYVSRMLANDAMNVVIDSSSSTGYIVDCLVANRDFLDKNPDIVQTVLECYFRALYEYRSPGRMETLVKSDAGDDSMIDDAVSKRLVKGIDWKNTLENYAHFGLDSEQRVQHLADMIDNITDVLLETGAIEDDPTDGKPKLLYFPEPLKSLMDSGFVPGGQSGDEVVDQAAPLRALSDTEWESLMEVGTIRVPTLVFAAGSEKLTPRSNRILDELVQQLNTWPQYYVIVRGNASLRGDLEANKRLAQRRAKAAEQYLVGHGVESRRIRAVGAEPTGSTSVSFLLGQLPY